MPETPEQITVQLKPAWEAAGEFPAEDIIEEFGDRHVEIPPHFGEYEFRQDKECLYVLHKPCGNIQVTAVYASMRRLANSLEQHAISCEEQRNIKP